MRVLELFSGTGSVGRAFERAGWEVVSLDVDRKCSASIHADVLTWDCATFPPDHFDCVWASPPCTQYSIARTTAKTPRNLELADSIVKRTLGIIAYFSPKVWWIENPWTGLLKSREVVQGLPQLIVDYCAYGSLYRKRTMFLTNVSWSFRRCAGVGQCPSMAGTRHIKSAQRRPIRINGVLTVGDMCTLDELHALPEDLCSEIVRATVSSLVSA